MSMGEIEVKNALIGNIHTLKTVNGYSAYDLAVASGFKGTLSEWLKSLEGKTAYEVAVDNGFEGTAEEWLASIKGEPGYTPRKNIDYFDGEKGEPGTLESHSEVDALGYKVVNVADPEEETDAVNKKYVDKLSSDMTQYASNNYVAKSSQLDASEKTIVNVAAPVNDTDAVNKKYVHDVFQNAAIEDISSDFISSVNENFTVQSVSVFKQGNIVSGTVTVRGDFYNTVDSGYSVPFVIKTKYSPKAEYLFFQSMMRTYANGYEGGFELSNVYLNDTPTVMIATGGGVAIAYTDLNYGFANEVIFGFSYLCL